MFVDATDVCEAGMAQRRAPDEACMRACALQTWRFTFIVANDMPPLDQALLLAGTGAATGVAAGAGETDAALSDMSANCAASVCGVSAVRARACARPSGVPGPQERRAA